MKVDKIEISGLIVLFVGVILLAFTFISAYSLLIGKLEILASTDLADLFGKALAPLITAIIHILYLGIMGWIGSILTIRAVQLLRQEREAVTAQPQAKSGATPSAVTPPPVPATSTSKAEPKPEVKEAKKVESPEKTHAAEQPVEAEKEAKAKQDS